MRVTITPGPLAGTIAPPPSKSQAHRVLLAAALADGTSVIRGPGWSEDIRATLRCVEALGAAYEESEAGVLTLRGISRTDRPAAELPRLDCGESGSTLRFLIPVALAVAGGGIFTGKGRLMARPQTPYFDLFREQGVSFSQDGDTLTVRGKLTPGVYRLPGNVSSQFITGLLYALPLLDGDSEILLTAPLESSGYIDLTLDALHTFGVTAARTEDGWQVPGNQIYAPQDIRVEQDWSQAAFFVAAKGLGSALTLDGMNEASRQGDRIILDYERLLDGPGPAALDVSGCPDLVPALAARAALRDGEITRIVNAGRLRLKESDRLASVTAVLTALGADISEEPEGLTIRGRESLPGGAAVDSWNDHRIAMMAAVAATRCLRPVAVTGAECVQKSYPNFWDDYRALGGRLEVSNA